MLDEWTRHRPDPRLLDELFEAEAHLFPLTAHDDETIELRARGKRPLRKGWNDPDARPLTRKQAEAHMHADRNIGERLKPDDLVVDIDPRHFQDGRDYSDPDTASSASLKAWEEFCTELGVDRYAWPLFVTGSGGLHVRLRKPADTAIVTKLEGWPGFEFKTAGTFIVTPGSVHAQTGRHYKPHVLNFVALKDAPEAPDQLLDMLRRPAAETANGGGELEPEALERLLDALDPTDYGRGKYNEWIRLCAACVDATGGGSDALAVFARWCAGDPNYGPEAFESIERHWCSFEPGRPDGATAGTLFKAIVDAGRPDLVSEIIGEAERDEALEMLKDEPLDSEPETEASEADDSERWADAAEGDVADIPPTPWLTKGLLLYRDLTLLNGRGGSGKSLMAWQIAVAVATGIGFACWDAPERRRKVMVLSGEDDVDEVRRRVAVACQAMSVERADLQGWFLIRRSNDIRLVRQDDKGIAVTALWKEVRRMLHDRDIGLLVIDPAMKSSMGFDENSNDEMELAQNWIRGLTRGLDCAVLLLDHARKGTGDDRDAGRGASAKGDDARVSCLMRQLTDKEYKELKTRTPRESLVLFTTIKSNYGAPSGMQVFQFRDYEVGNSETRPALIHRSQAQLAVTFQEPEECPFRDELMQMVAEGRDYDEHRGWPWCVSNNAKGHMRLDRDIAERFNVTVDEARQWLKVFEDAGLIEKVDWWSPTGNQSRVWRVAE